MLTEKQLEQIRIRAGTHSELGQLVPSDAEQRLYYGLLEILDFKCCEHDDIPPGVTEEGIKEYLLVHKDRVKVEAISSYLGLLSGVFDFFAEGRGL